MSYNFSLKRSCLNIEPCVGVDLLSLKIEYLYSSFEQVGEEPHWILRYPHI